MKSRGAKRVLRWCASGESEEPDAVDGVDVDIELCGNPSGTK